jgi:hypothetical protein
VAESLVSLYKIRSQGNYFKGNSMKQLLTHTHKGRNSAGIIFITNHIKIIDESGDMQLKQTPHLSVGPVFLTFTVFHLFKCEGCRRHATNLK